jgi:hypothetical protein
MKYSFDPAKLRPMTKVKVILGKHKRWNRFNL